MDRPRRPQDPFAAAEAAFRKSPPKPAIDDNPKTPTIPGARQMVSLRLDEAVLDYFQADGPGWQDRVNEALKTLIKP